MRVIHRQSSNKLEEDAKHVELELREAWDVWARLVANAPEEVHPLLTARNPEIVSPFSSLRNVQQGEFYRRMTRRPKAGSCKPSFKFRSLRFQPL